MANRVQYRNKPPRGAVVNGAYPLSQGLVGCWLFNEQGGIKVNDLSGKNIIGTLTSGPLWNNQALTFDGTDDYITMGNASPLSFGTGLFSISVWIRTNTSVRRTVLQKFDFDGVSVEKGYYIDVLANGKIRAGMESDNANYRLWDSVSAVNDNLWHHIVLVRTDTSAVSLYVDGVLSNGAATDAGTVSDTSNSNAFEIGRNIAAATFTTYFSGQIDNVRVYNRRLSYQEIKELYSTPFAGFLVPKRRMISQHATATINSNFFATF